MTTSILRGMALLGSAIMAAILVEPGTQLGWALLAGLMVGIGVHGWDK